MATTTTRLIRIRNAQEQEVVRLTQRLPWLRPLVITYFRRRRLAEAAPDAAQRVLQVLARSRVRARPGTARFRELVFTVLRDRERKLRERRHQSKRWRGRVHGLEDFDVISSEDDPRAGFDRLWLQVLLLGCLNRMRRERPDLFATLEETIVRRREVSELAYELGEEPAVVRKRSLRAKARLAVYLRQEVRRYGRDAVDVEAELERFIGWAGFAPLPDRVGLSARSA